MAAGCATFLRQASLDRRRLRQALRPCPPGNGRGDTTRYAFGEPTATLSPEQLAQFQAWQATQQQAAVRF